MNYENQYFLNWRSIFILMVLINLGCTSKEKTREAIKFNDSIEISQFSILQKHCGDIGNCQEIGIIDNKGIPYDPDFNSLRINPYNEIRTVSSVEYARLDSLKKMRIARIEKDKERIAKEMEKNKGNGIVYSIKISDFDATYNFGNLY